MRITFIFTALLFSLSVFAAPTGSWQITPRPQQVELKQEKPFVINSKTTICVVGSAEDMQRNATFLQQNIEEMTGIKPEITAAAGNKQITLAIDASMNNEEGYAILTDNKRIDVKGKTPAAVFYAIQTITKALPVAPGSSSVALPAARVTDAPRFHFRGFLVDVGRHYFSVPYIKRIIDMLALHNINYFHWHLTEDQGWRLDIKKYPRLTTIGSYRKETISNWETKEYDGTPHSGYYTQDDARNIVRYAAERYITVIPEIDLPGHSLAALAAYPELGCTGGPYEVATTFGVFPDVLCGGNPQTLQFAKDVINEVMDIFPSPYIHLGGDECPKDRWKVCPKCQARIKELGLTDKPGQSKEDQLQTVFMNELEKVINARGRKLIGWDEVLDGAPSKSITVMAWTSYNAALRSARMGHPTVVVPISNLYFSNPRWNKLTGRESIERVYDLEPVSPILEPAEQKNIIGVEACIWTEWTKDSTKMEWQMMPRIAAMSELAWAPKYDKNLDTFMQALRRLRAIYDLRGYNYKKDIFGE